jgi:hypothetical protein
MATNPSFIGVPNITQVNVSTANTNLDGSGTVTSLITGAAQGTRVLEVNAQIAITPAGASTASIVRVFLSTDSGSTWRLFDEITLASTTSSNSAKSTRNVATYANLVLKDTTQRLGVTTSVSQSTNVIALAGDL